MNVALVAPAATVTLVGTVTNDVELVRLTDTPPLGAAALRVTVPVLEFPAETVDGDKLNALRGTRTVSVAFSVTDPAVAPIVAVTCDELVWVVRVNVALVAPAATVTLLGTVT